MNSEPSSLRFGTLLGAAAPFRAAVTLIFILLLVLATGWAAGQ